VVPAPLRLAAVERGAVADRDERVLERRPARVVRVDVAGRDRADAERLREVAERAVAARVAALVRPLELDVEALGPERLGELARRVRVADAEAVARAAGQAEEAVVALAQERRVERRRHELRAFLRPGSRVRRGEQPAEVRVAARRLDEQRHVVPPGQRHLGTGDRAHAERLRRVRELERAVEAVVVGERERAVAELGGAERELLRVRRAVEERVRRVAVELDVAGRAAARGSRRRSLLPPLAARRLVRPVAEAVVLRARQSLHRRSGVRGSAPVDA
jgi:hypothetical protein